MKDRKDYEWTVTKSLYIQVDYENIYEEYRWYRNEEKEDKKKAIHDGVMAFLGGLDDEEYYNLTPKIKNAIENDFKAWMKENGKK